MSIKRTIITTVVALALVAVVAPVVASAATVQDLMTQIAALQAQLQGLSGSTTTASGTGACAGVTFTRNLTVGSTGTDVKCLQQILSVTPQSGYFGPITLAAVQAYQTSKGFTPASQVGPLTRAALNTSLASSTSTTTTTTTGGGLCPNGNTLASNCSVSGTTTTTTTTQTGINTPGATGYLTIPELSASPASNANVTTTSNVPVLGVDVRATGSDMIVSSAEVQLTVMKQSSPAAEEFPSTAIQNLYVYDGSTLLGTYPVNSTTVLQSSGNSTTYYMILSGFKFVAPMNTTKSLLIEADFAPGLETNRQVTVNLYSQGLRAVDGSGAYSSVSTGSNDVTLVSGSSITPDTYGYRQYLITYGTSIGISTLTVAADTSTPISTSVNVNATSGTTNVPMLLVDAKSTTGSSTITNMKFTVTGSNAAVAKVTALRLYNGSTLLGSQSLSGSTSGATATFNNLSIPVAQDATVQLTVSADFGSGVTSASSVAVGIAAPSTDVTYQTPNLSSTYPTSGAVVGSTMYLYNGISADLSFTNATSTYSYNSTSPSLSYTTGVITFKAHADGGTMAALTNSIGGTNGIKVGYNAGSGSGTLAASAVNVDFAPVGGIDGNPINDGGDAIVTVTVTMPRGTSNIGFLNFYISEIDWTVGGQAGIATYASGQLSNYKTPYANVQ
jgi:hypothetical protein